MKRFLLVIFAAAVVSASAQEKIYLSPGGSDSGTGTQDSPLYSLNAAARLARQQTDESTQITVCIAPGEYFMQEPLVLTAEDATQIEFVAMTDEKPVFYGGIEVGGWKPAGNGVWKTHVQETSRYGFYFEQFYVDGKRAVRARTPNKDWSFVTGSSEIIRDRGTARSPEYAVQTIMADPVDLVSLRGLTLPEVNDVTVTFYHKWDVTRKPLSFVNLDSGHMFTVGAGMKEWNTINKGARFVMENYRAALDEPGEWFLDRSGDLYYMPREGEDMSKVRCFAPVLKQFIIVSGEENKPVKEKTFRGLSFRYAAYNMPPGGNEPMQAAAGIEAAIMLDHGCFIAFDDCEVMHTGGYAFWVRRECNDVSIKGCFITDLGAGGVKIGETVIRDKGRFTNRIVVMNNIIRHAGYVFPCAVGVSIFHAADNLIRHNEISDFRYSGISIGWMWGYLDQMLWTTYIDEKGNLEFKNVPGNSPARGNIVDYNHIHHIGWGELSDMGAVYTLGHSPGTRVCNNVIHDIYSYDYGGWGLYTDEGSTGIVMENNLVYGCKSGGFHQHYGKDNVINNNIFAFGHYYQLQFTRPEPHRSFEFKHNIVIADCGVMFSGPWAEAKMDMDSNCYWDLRTKDPLFRDMPFKEWQNIKDKHSIVADPMFADAAGLDFRFSSNKAIKKIGFVPFDYTKAGVLGPEEWRRKAEFDPSIAEAFRQVILRREKEHSRIYDFPYWERQ